MIGVHLFLAVFALLLRSTHPLPSNNAPPTWSYNVRFGVTSVPAYSTDLGLIYVATKIGQVIAVNSTNGKLVWTLRTGIVALTAKVSSPSILKLPASSGKPCTTTLYVGGVFAANACDGELLWHTSLIHTNYSSPSPALIANVSRATTAPQPLLYVNGESSLYALGAREGRRLFNVSLSGKSCTKPVVADRLVIVCTSPDPAHSPNDGTREHDGSVFALDATSGAQVWKYSGTHGTSFLSAPAVDDARGVLVVSSTAEKHAIVALKLKSGIVQWSISTPTRVAASPIIAADGAVYSGCYDGTIFSISSDGMKLWVSTQLDSIVNTSPQFSMNGKGIYASTTVGTLYYLDRISGELLWKRREMGTSLVPPLPLNAHDVLFTSMDGMLQSYDTVIDIPDIRSEKPDTPTLPPTDHEEDDGTARESVESADEEISYEVIVGSSGIILAIFSALLWRHKKIGKLQDCLCGIQRWIHHVLKMSSSSPSGGSRTLDLVPLMSPTNSVNVMVDDDDEDDINPFRSPHFHDDGDDSA